MSRDEVVYHLGAHKTASSLIQKFLRDSPELLRRHRLAYLGRGEMNELVGWGKRVLKRPQLLQDRLAELLADRRCDRVVTSHENTLGPPIKPGGAHLYPRGPEIAEALAGALGRWSSRVIVHLRPQAEFVESYYLQRIHQGDQLTFDEWIADVDLAALSWAPLVQALRDRFGPERVEVVDFGLIRQGQDAFLADFLRRVDPDLAAIAPSYAPIRNASVSDKGLRIALAANKHLRADWERKAMRKFLQRHFSNRSYPRPRLLTDEHKARLHQRYADEYEQLTGARPPEPAAAPPEGGESAPAAQPPAPAAEAPAVHPGEAEAPAAGPGAPATPAEER